MLRYRMKEPRLPSFFATTDYPQVPEPEMSGQYVGGPRLISTNGGMPGLQQPRSPDRRSAQVTTRGRTRSVVLDLGKCRFCWSLCGSG